MHCKISLDKLVLDLPIAENQRSASSKLNVANMNEQPRAARGGLANPPQKIIFVRTNLFHDLEGYPTFSD